MSASRAGNASCGPWDWRGGLRTLASRRSKFKPLVQVAPQSETDIFYLQTFVSASGYSSNRSALNFPDRPFVFDPSRWLATGSDGASVPASKSPSAFNPFSLGPRNCLGRNLAYLEMRLILTHLLWAFDLEVPGGTNSDTVGRWEEQKSWILWEKAPLMVRLKMR